MILKEHSPLLKDFKLIERGSGDLRRNLNHLWEKHSLTAEQTKKAIIKKSMVGRKGDPRGSRKNATGQTLALTSSSQKSRIEDPLFSTL